MQFLQDEETPFGNRKECLMARTNRGWVIVKRKCSKFVGWQGLILAIALVLCGLLERAYCQTNGSVLLLQQTPPQGGKITPDVGVHHFGLHTYVTLTAVPKPGYIFVYWMGDVSDPTANRTVVYLDAPKIVIAVFERDRYEHLDIRDIGRSAPIGGVFVGAAEYGRGGFTGGGGKKPKPHNGETEEIPEPDFPVPVPEPAVVYMLGLAGLALMRKRRAK